MNCALYERRPRVTAVNINDISKSLFGDNKNVLVFDVDGVVLHRIKTYFNGVRGFDSYVVDKNARRVIDFATERFDEVVLWSASSNYIENFGGKLFNKVPIHIVGVCSDDSAECGFYKDLRKINENVKRVVAIEDDDMFRPKERVVKVNGNENLVYVLQSAIALP
ncbi:hypothetical protein HYV50_00945 [Candidatus Pacearchaeota archaeon]|nr:hypothetical protein [Candidatus Pacearchaeota archaeon]